MAVLRDKPYGNFNFLVNLGSGEAEGPEAGFQEVTIPDVWMDVIEYRNGNDKENTVRKLTGLAHYGNVVLKRGLIGSLNLYEWFNEIRQGKQDALRTVQIELLSEDRSNVVASWKLLRARPVRISWGPLNAKGKEIAVETLELACEGLVME